MDMTMVKDIYIPEGDVRRIDANGHQIWQRLPMEYQEVEYIESHGTEYIDTMLNPTLADKYELCIRRTTTAQQWIFGNNGGNGWSIELRSGTGAFWRSEGVGFTRDYFSVDGLFHIFKFDLNSFTIDDAEATPSAIAYKMTPSQGIRLFGTKHGSTDDFFGSCSIKYYIRKNANQQVVQHLIPCYRISDNEIGMYDLVNGTFFTNQGTGVFTKGADV